MRETDQAYELDIDLPGFKKEDVQAKLENGYLTVSASKGLNRDEKDKKGRYIRRERYAGSAAAASMWETMWSPSRYPPSLRMVS